MIQDKTIWDRCGAAASSLCAIHCVLSGLFLGLLSSAGLSFIASGPVEWLFFGAALILGLFAIRSGVRKHRKLWPAALFTAGFLLLILHHWIYGPHSQHHIHEVTAENWIGTAMAVMGGLTLVAFHIVNARLSHKASQCPCCS